LESNVSWGDRRSVVLGVATALGVILTVAGVWCGARFMWPVAHPATIALRGGVLLLGAAIGQCLASPLVEGLRTWFFARDDTLAELKNRRPPRLLGLAESVAYPWLFFDLEPDAAGAVVAAWLVLKTVGNWKGWDDSEQSDKHRGRRRLYAFLLGNAFQLAWAAGIATIMRAVYLPSQ
jgi:hypothetical protein